MSTDVYHTVRHYQNCPRIGTKFKCQCLLKPFTPSGSFELNTIGIIGPLPRAKSGAEYVVIITDQYSKLTRVVLTLNTLSTHLH